MLISDCCMSAKSSSLSKAAEESALDWAPPRTENAARMVMRLTSDKRAKWMYGQDLQAGQILG